MQTHWSALTHSPNFRPRIRHPSKHSPSWRGVTTALPSTQDPRISKIAALTAVNVFQFVISHDTRHVDRVEAPRNRRAFRPILSVKKYTFANRFYQLYLNTRTTRGTWGWLCLQMGLGLGGEWIYGADRVYRSRRSSGVVHAPLGEFPQEGGRVHCMV